MKVDHLSSSVQFLEPLKITCSQWGDPCRPGEVEESDILVSGERCTGPIGGQTCSAKPDSAMRPWTLQETFWSWSYLPQVPAWGNQGQREWTTELSQRWEE